MYRKISRMFLLLTALLLVAIGTVQWSTAQTVNVYQTNADQSLLLTQQPSVSFGSSSNGSTTITINPAVKYQQMDGFGASLSDSSAYLIYNKLTSTQQTALMNWFFNSSAGIGLNWLRQPMGASDFSAQGNFSYDDVAAGQTDVNLTSFSISKDLTYTIPVLKQAFAVNPNIKVQMLPWSPPAWMKTSGTMNGGNFDDAYYSSLSNYFVKAIQAYKAQGIPVYAISAQNEPENSNSSYPTESFSASEEATFIGSYLGPALSTAGLAPKILAYEHNWGDTTYPETVLGTSTASPYIAGTSWHCYSGSPSAQSTVEAAYPNDGIWFTECTGETNGTFNGDLAWGMENLIIGATRNYAKSVAEWNLALDQNSGPTNGYCTNCRGFVTINDSVSPATITYNVENYIYGHAAKFVAPGAYRVQSNSAAAGAGGIEDVAFQNPDGSVVLIAFNDGGSAATFDVNWATNNTNFSYSLPAGAVATFTWSPSTTPAPVAPTNLTATAASSSQINLAWTASTTSGVTYSVFCSTASSFTPSSSNQMASGISATSYAVAGLLSGTAYYCEVEATGSTGTSGPSNQATATTTTGGLAAPTTLTGSAVSNTEIDLNWTATSGGVSYSIFRSTQSGFTPSSSNQIASNIWVTNFADKCVTQSQTYYYVVEALNSTGASAPSNQLKVVATVLPPVAASGLAATGVSAAQISLTWNASSTLGVTYNVYRSTTSGFTPSTGNMVASGVNKTFYSNTGLNASTTYYYEVVAVNSAGSSAASNQASAITAANDGTSVSTTSYYQIVNQASGNCLDDTGAGITNGTVLQQYTCYSNSGNQEWMFTPTSGGYYKVTTYNSNAVGWDVVNSGTSPGTNVQLYTYAGGLNEQFETVQLSAGYYELIDRNSGLCLNVPGGATTNNLQLQVNTCNGATSESFQLNVIAATVPTAPSSLTATAASSSQVNLSWTASSTSGVTYSVYGSTTSGFTPGSSNLIASGLSATNYSNTGLTAATTYYYIVEAVNSVGSSPASNQASATTTAVAPTAPTSLTATAASSTQINLSWTASSTSGVTYSVYGSTTSGFTPGSGNLITSGLSATTYSNTGLTASTTHYYVVEAVNSVGSSPASNQASATTTAAAPTAPTALTATAASSTQINLSWTASSTSGVAYSVYGSTTNGFTPGSSNLITSGLSATTYSNTGLTASTTHYYVVEAVNSVGSSPASNQASATTSSTGGSISSTAYYTIVNQASGNCLDDTGASVANGTVLQQWTCTAGDVNQEWLFTATNGGYYEVTSYNSSSLAWDVTNVGTAPGTTMQLWAYGGGLNQQFEPVLLSTGYYEFIDRNSGLCLNVPNGATTNGLQLQINTCNGATSESFQMNAIVAGVPTAPTSLTATTASNSQINLSWTASSTSDVTYSVYRATTSGFTPSTGNLISSGLSTTTYSNTGLTAATTYYYIVEAVNSVGSSPASNQASALTAAASGISTTAYYEVVNEASGSCLDDTGGSTANGTVLQQWVCTAESVNQEWLFTATSGGYYEITSHNSSTLAWDVTNVGTTPGTTMQLWAYGGGLNQQFEPVLLSTGYYEFIDRNSGLCLNVPNGATTNGLQLQINTCNGATSESFELNQQ